MNAITPISTADTFHKEAAAYIRAIVDNAADSADAETFADCAIPALEAEAAEIEATLTDLEAAFRIAADRLIKIGGHISADVAETLSNYKSDMFSDAAYDCAKLLAPGLQREADQWADHCRHEAHARF